MSDVFNNWRTVPQSVFRPLVADRRDDYLAILACFKDAFFEPALNLATLADLLRNDAPSLATDDEALHSCLSQLTEWGLLEKSQDESFKYNSFDEYRRRHSQWMLTHHGQAAIAAVSAAFGQLRDYADLQPAAIDVIASALSTVADQFDNPGGPDAAVIDTQLQTAEMHHRLLIDNLSLFMRNVQRSLNDADVSTADLEEAKRHIVSYIDNYVLGTEAPANRVLIALNRLRHHGFDHVADVATQGANLVTITGAPDADATADAVAARRVNLNGLDNWFNVDGEFSKLGSKVRNAIGSYIRVISILHEIRGRSASLPDDFRALARACVDAPTNADAHRLWGAATGLLPARHHSLVVDDTTDPSSGNPAHQNPPAVIEIELRDHAGGGGHPGRGAPIPDRRAARAIAQQKAAAELEQLKNMQVSLVTEGPVRVSSFSELSREQFTFLFQLIADALAAVPSAPGKHTARSTDGLIEIVVDTNDPRSDDAELTPPHGTLRLKDYLVEVTLVASGPTRTSPSQEDAA